MERFKKTWKQIPDAPRRLLTLLVGILLIIVSGLIGWIPGPGGMVPFLLGIAVLATEFTWAERIRDRIIILLKKLSVYARKKPLFTVILFLMMLSIVFFSGYVFYTKII